MSPSGASRALSGESGTRAPRVVTLVVLAILLIAALVGIDLLVLNRNNPVQALTPHYYMALGDSLSFGYQPNLDFSSGFADDIYNYLRPANVTSLENYACAGEKTDTMIHGGCPGSILHKGSYTGPQLQAAIDFLKAERNFGRVSPITLEIGSNDVIPDWNESTCSPNSNADADLAQMDANLTQVILPQLLDALGAGHKANNGDLHMLNYYNPYAKECPGSAPFIHMLNDHLAADAAKFRIPVVDVYAAFGGDSGMASHICDYTWICSQFHDVHPTNLGYQIIAKAVENTLALPGGAPLPGVVPPAPAGAILAPVAAFWRRSDAAWVA
ncbi:MAG: SGNH/GDSL hydrolase family protein [Ktedonobacterales bacterium]